MKKHFRFLLLCFIFACMAILAGCGKENAGSLNTPEVIQQSTSPQEETEQSQDTIPQEHNTAVTFDYAPGSMGIYVKADQNMTADPEVLDSLTMTLSDKESTLTRHRVSDCQFDFVKNGRQIGGCVLVDIPKDMLQKKPENWEEFETIVEHVALQIMTDGYPSKSYIGGGGHADFGVELTPYMFFSIESDEGAVYNYNIYIGETYVYVLWNDTAWMGDAWSTIMSTLSAEDIKAELNQVEDWTIHDFDDWPDWFNEKLAEKRKKYS